MTTQSSMPPHIDWLEEEISMAALVMWTTMSLHKIAWMTTTKNIPTTTTTTTTPLLLLNSLPLHGVGVEEDRSDVEINCISSANYDILNVDDILPIETARDRFLQIIVDHFIDERIIEVADYEVGYSGESVQDKLHERNSRDVQYEGDPRFVLPLMYVANLYETLVNNVNVRLAPLDGIREKTIGVALEAAGGLYRSFRRKFHQGTTSSIHLAINLGQSVSNIPGLLLQNQQQSASKHDMQPIQPQPQPQPQIYSLGQFPQQPMHQGLHASHFSETHQFVPSEEISHALQSPTMSQHVTPASQEPELGEVCIKW